MDTSAPVFYAAGLPALISTGVTCIYFLLKAACYLFHAISHKTKGRVAMTMPGCGQHEYSSDQGEEGDTEICKQVLGHFSEQYGGGIQRSSGSVPLSRRRKDLCLPSCRDAAEYSKEPVVREDAKRLQGRRCRNTQDNYGEEPSDPYLNSEGIPTKSSIRENASNGQPSDDAGTGRESNCEWQHEVYDDGVPRCRNTGPAGYTKSTKTQVAHASLQTDSCGTLYVTKNTLTAYTIAVVQNAQAIQYDQMHVALQTARNQASLETPLNAEELMTAHFNLAVLTNELDSNKTTDAQNPEANTIDAEPAASAADEETYVKIPSCNYSANCDTKKQHPTGAVVPTCRREYGLVNEIPAGYETDDSWDNDSHTHEHTHNIVPLLTLRPWSNRLHRGREQHQRQNNNIPVRPGKCTVLMTLGQSAIRKAHMQPTSSSCQSLP